MSDKALTAANSMRSPRVGIFMPFSKSSMTAVINAGTVNMNSCRTPPSPAMKASTAASTPHSGFFLPAPVYRQCSPKSRNEMHICGI